jgi:hypothetical protein
VLASEATMNERHIPRDELMEYFAARLPEAREAAIEEHFADCLQCTEQARALQRVSAVVDGWSARAHGEAHRREMLAAALARA